MEPPLSYTSLGKYRKECTELLQRSPHPSRPQVAAEIDVQTWQRIHMLFQYLQIDPDRGNSDGEDSFLGAQFAALTDLCLFVRNTAAMEQVNQNVASRIGVVGYVRRVLLRAVEREITCPEAMNCAVAAAQAMSNLVTGNQALQRQLVTKEMKLDHDNAFWYMVSSVSSKTVVAGMVCLLNCIKGSEELTKLLCQSKSGSIVVTKVGELFGENEDAGSDTKDLFYKVLDQTIRSRCLPLAIGGEPDLSSYGLFDALAVYCNEHKDAAEDGCSELLTVDMGSVLARVLAKINEVLSNAWNDEHTEMDDIMNAHRSLVATLSILGTITSKGATGISDRLLGCKVLEPLVAMLGLLDKHLPRIENAKQQQDKIQDEEDVSMKRLFMYKCELISIIGNVSHNSRAVQDRMRELDGLALVLNNMKIDDNHPFIREYAVVALKSLLDNNSANQTYVDGMKPAQKPGST